MYWSVRLSVRTPGFHPGKGGSIPPRTTKKASEKSEAFLFLGTCTTFNLTNRILIFGRFHQLEAVLR